jgi:ribosomal protein L32
MHSRQGVTGKQEGTSSSRAGKRKSEGPATAAPVQLSPKMLFQRGLAHRVCSCGCAPASALRPARGGRVLRRTEAPFQAPQIR